MRILIEDVIVVGSEQQVDDGAQRGRILSSGFLGKTVDVGLGAGGPVEIGYFEDEAGGLEEDVGEQRDADMVDFLVRAFDIDMAPVLETATIVEEGFKLGGVALEPGAGEKSHVVDNGIGAARVIEAFEQKSQGGRRIVR